MASAPIPVISVILTYLSMLPYDVSPIKVIHQGQQPKMLTNFWIGVCAFIGGTLTVAATIGRGMYQG
jgi:uncharacterized membrane protein